MNLKTTSFLISGLLLANPVCFANSHQQSSTSTKAPITLIKTNQGASSRRPKAPDRQTVTCAYDGEYILISFVIPEGTATISVTDEIGPFSYNFDTSPLYITIPVMSLHGNTYVEIETESGNTYQGIME